MSDARIVGSSAAERSLKALEDAIIDLPASEQAEVSRIRSNLRLLIKQYDSSAQLAIMCAAFEISIFKGE